MLHKNNICLSQNIFTVWWKGYVCPLINIFIIKLVANPYESKQKPSTCLTSNTMGWGCPFHFEGGALSWFKKNIYFTYSCTSDNKPFPLFFFYFNTNLTIYVHRESQKQECFPNWEGGGGLPPPEFKWLLLKVNINIVGSRKIIN